MPKKIRSVCLINLSLYQRGRSFTFQRSYFNLTTYERHQTFDLDMKPSYQSLPPGGTQIELQYIDECVSLKIYRHFD